MTCGQMHGPAIPMYIIHMFIQPLVCSSDLKKCLQSVKLYTIYRYVFIWKVVFPGSILYSSQSVLIVCYKRILQLVQRVLVDGSSAVIHQDTAQKKSKAKNPDIIFTIPLKRNKHLIMEIMSSFVSPGNSFNKLFQLHLCDQKGSVPCLI